MIRAENSEAVAYSFLMLIFLIVIAALAYAYLIPGINKVTGQLNKQIDQGKISEQTTVVYNWNVAFFTASIGIGLLGFSIWAITRAIEISEAG